MMIGKQDRVKNYYGLNYLTLYEYTETNNTISSST